MTLTARIMGGGSQGFDLAVADDLDHRRAGLEVRGQLAPDLHMVRAFMRIQRLAIFQRSTNTNWFGSLPLR